MGNQVSNHASGSSHKHHDGYKPVHTIGIMTQTPTPVPASTTSTSTQTPVPVPASTTSTSTQTPVPVPTSTTSTSTQAPVPASTTSVSAQTPTPVPASTTGASVQTPVQYPAPKTTGASVPCSTATNDKNARFTHPLIEMIRSGASDAEMCQTLQAYCGRELVYVDENGTAIYDIPDQMEFLEQVTIVLGYAADNNRLTLAKWILENFIPIQVSHDDNWCYHRAVAQNYEDIVDMLVQHESFVPDHICVEDMLRRQKYNRAVYCLQSPNLMEPYVSYRYTMMHYIRTCNFVALIDLANQLRTIHLGYAIDITHPKMNAPDQSSSDECSVTATTSTPSTPSVVQPLMQFPSTNDVLVVDSEKDSTIIPDQTSDNVIESSSIDKLTEEMKECANIQQVPLYQPYEVESVQDQPIQNDQDQVDRDQSIQVDQDQVEQNDQDDQVDQSEQVNQDDQIDQDDQDQDDQDQVEDQIDQVDQVVQDQIDQVVQDQIDQVVQDQIDQVVQDDQPIQIDQVVQDQPIQSIQNAMTEDQELGLPME